ncbi:hypothetical protein BD769DRAFT_1667155 [Suillus cothurnatus]|nr:hypothetical protein BD769DRAFT_1667155 [Suillus cothurnatus]
MNFVPLADSLISSAASANLIEEVDPAYSIADRAKTHTWKTQVKKPTYAPVNHDKIELAFDLGELFLKPPRK